MIKSFQDKTPIIHDSVFVAENAMIIGDVEIGEDASIWYNCMLRGDVNYIRIGARTNVQDATVIHVSRKTYPTILEDEVTVGHGVTLHGCYVETGSLIGIGSIILDGARIGKNSLVAACDKLKRRMFWVASLEVEVTGLIFGAPKNSSTRQNMRSRGKKSGRGLQRPSRGKCWTL